MATMSKTKRILDHLSKNPAHTWKDAQSKLEKHDISGAYFAMVKSKHLGKPSTGETTPGKKRGPKVRSAGNEQLQQAADFAKSCGGIQNALAVLTQLEKVQIN